MEKQVDERGRVISRKHDRAQTAYQRLLKSDVDERVKMEVTKIYENLNLVKLRERSKKLQIQLFKGVASRTLNSDLIRTDKINAAMEQSQILIINKPKSVTSHDVVDEVRRITGEKKVGHAGTLDPSATGVLVVLVGREATKRSNMLGIPTHQTGLRRTRSGRFSLDEAVKIKELRKGVKLNGK